MIVGKFLWLFSFATLFADITVNANNEDCATLPPPRDGGVQLAFSESDQLLAIYTCDQGFALVGNTVLSCVNERWNKIPPLCVSLEECAVDSNTTGSKLDLNRCPKLRSPRFGRMDNDLMNKGAMEMATFNCFKAYRLNGPSALFCEDGFWSGRVPQCNPVDCGEPEAPTNGTVEFKDTHFMERAHYKCDACHILRGYKQRSCKPSGTWSKSMPECMPMFDTPVCSLLNLELPEGAVTSSESDLSMTCGQTVKVQCNQGFKLEGADTATCNIDGSFSWNGSAPSCN